MTWIPIDRLGAERDRWVLWLPVAFATGVAIYFGLKVEPPLWSGTAALGATVLAWSVHHITGSAVHRTVMLGLVAVGTMASGFVAAQIRTADVAAATLTKRIGPVGVSGRVYRHEAFPDSARLTLEEVRISGLPAPQTPSRIRIRARGAQPDIEPGDWVRFRAMLSPPPPPAAPHAFDFQRQLFFRGIGGVGFSLGRGIIVAKADLDGLHKLQFAVSRTRRALTERITDSLAGTAGGIAAALMTGERSAVPKDVMQNLRDSGLAHLLAISGLHIGLVAGLLFAGLRGLLAAVPALALIHPIKKWAAAMAIAGAFAYALVAGATLPTQRAFLMVGLALVAVIVDRRGLSMRSVAWAALIILAVQPESLLGASFQMSFAAVTALIAAFEVYRDRRLRTYTEPSALPYGVRIVLLYLAGVFLTTLVAGTATAPFAVYHFNRFADYGLAANLVAVPVTALWVMPCAILAFFLMPFSLEVFALVPMAWGIEIVVAVAETVAGWPGAVTRLAAMPTWGLIATVLGGVWLCLWTGRWRRWGIIGIACGLATIALVMPPDILVDGSGRLIAVRGLDGRMAFSNSRKARFERDVWLRLAGQEETAAGAFPDPGMGVGERLSCDISGCVVRANGRVVAVVYGEEALSEECWSADAVVSVLPVRRYCPAPYVIDRFTLWREGGHALWLEEGGIRVESVNGARGDRPWVVRPGRKSGTTKAGT